MALLGPLTLALSQRERGLSNSSILLSLRQRSTQQLPGQCTGMLIITEHDFSIHHRRHNAGSLLL